VYADFPGKHEALVVLAYDLQRRPIGWILSQAVTDRRGTGGNVRKRPVWAIMSR
jgi:hypothetical protein